MNFFQIIKLFSAFLFFLNIWIKLYYSTLFAIAFLSCIILFNGFPPKLDLIRLIKVLKVLKSTLVT